jgi:predicted  nucleic acid-binding Zn-ribbon protein
MKAPVEDQQRLLVVQQHDTALHQLAYKREHLDVAARHAAATQVATRLGEAVATARAATSDVQRELTRLEDEVEKVKQRRQRDQERLDSGGGQSRELQALAHEIEALDKRQVDLEDVELEIMERLEGAQGEQTGLENSLAQAQAQVEALGAELATELGAIDQAMAGEAQARSVAAEGLDAALMKLYERLRERGNGVGAAPLVSRRCDGCRMELNAGDLSAIRAAAADDVVRCEECGRILIRGEDSGL